MSIHIAITILASILAFIWGMRLGRVLLKRGATAHDLFKSRNPLSLAFLGLYIGFMVIILNVPQLEFLPLEWRFHGMRMTWILMRVVLMGFCGAAVTITWHTARSQMVAIAIVSLLGLGALGSAEHYLLAPIHGSLHNNLLPNGVFRQTSSSSCAPAALATLLRQWGIAATESEVAKFAETSRLGTSMPQLIVAANAFGLNGVELRPTWKLMQRINRPGVLSVWLISPNRKLPHAVALLGLDATKAIIADPSSGKLFDVNRADFDTIWRGQYVPIFEPEELVDAEAKVETYLRQLGYEWPQASGLSVKEAIAQFQRSADLPVTGDLTLNTKLALSGAFLQSSPRLDQFEDKLLPPQPGSDVRYLRQPLQPKEWESPSKNSP